MIFDALSHCNSEVKLEDHNKQCEVMVLKLRFGMATNSWSSNLPKQRAATRKTLIRYDRVTWKKMRKKN